MLPAARWHVGGKKYSNTVIFSSAYHFLYSTFRIQQQCMSDGKEQFGIFAAEVDNLIVNIVGDYSTFRQFSDRCVTLPTMLESDCQSVYATYMDNNKG